MLTDHWELISISQRIYFYCNNQFFFLNIKTYISSRQCLKRIAWGAFVCECGCIMCLILGCSAEYIQLSQTWVRNFLIWISNRNRDGSEHFENLYVKLILTCDPRDKMNINMGKSGSHVGRSISSTFNGWRANTVA